MKRKDVDEGRHIMTDDFDKISTRPSKTEAMLPAQFDPRIVEIVRFIARTAAEKDYAELIARTRRETEGEKEIL